VNDGFACRDAVDADIEKTADEGTKNARENREKPGVLGSNFGVVGRHEVYA
jgi:hypothetical protein